MTFRCFLLWVLDKALVYLTWLTSVGTFSQHLLRYLHVLDFVSKRKQVELSYLFTIRFKRSHQGWHLWRGSEHSVVLFASSNYWHCFLVSICDFYLISRAGVNLSVTSARCFADLFLHILYTGRECMGHLNAIWETVCVIGTSLVSSKPHFFPSLAPGTKVPQLASSPCEIQDASVQVQYDINKALVLFSSLVPLLDTALNHTHVPCYWCF